METSLRPLIEVSIPECNTKDQVSAVDQTDACVVTDTGVAFQLDPGMLKVLRSGCAISFSPLATP